MTLRESLSQAEATLSFHNIADARIEAELLLMSAMGVGRAELYTRLEDSLPLQDAEGFWKLVQRRSCHEPTAYILKDCQFYGIDFYIDSRAFIPRPESELLVEQILEFARQLCSPFKVEELNKKTKQMVYRYRKTNYADHFRHCLNYLVLAGNKATIVHNSRARRRITRAKNDYARV